MKFPWARPAIVPDFWTVLDVDDLTWLSDFGHLVPPTYRYRTARGFHFYFQRVPHLKSSVGKIADKVDILTGIKPVLFWPHINGLRPIEAIPAPFPEGLLALASNNSPSVATLAAAGGEPAGSSPMPGTASSRALAAGLPVSSRERDGPLVGGVERRLPKPLYTKLCRLVPVGGNVTGHDQRRVRGALSMLLEKREGRNDALNWTAHEIFRPLIASCVLTCAAAESLLLDAAMLNGYVAKDGWAAALATIRSGLGRSDPTTRGPSLSLDDAQAEA